jgi:uncharacterized surface protein with fasciclin (FAS1) repeats
MTPRIHATRTFSAQHAHIKLTLSLRTMPDSNPVQEHITQPQLQGHLMKLVQKTFLGLLIGFGATAAMAGMTEAKKSPGTIVAVAAANPDFSTLVTAVKAAGLVDTLNSKGPFTVFAPTNEAFAKLPAGTVESLLKPENKDKLVAILTYHVVSGKVLAADVVKLKSANTVNGKAVAIDASMGVKVNDASVTATDIKASNGVIHVIDTVLIP